jgi:hypothetical protein
VVRGIAQKCPPPLDDDSGTAQMKRAASKAIAARRISMRTPLNKEQKAVLEVCKQVDKSGEDEFSMKWLRSAGHKIHCSKLMQLVDLGYLAVRYNGILRRGNAWYSVV